MVRADRALKGVLGVYIKASGGSFLPLAKPDDFWGHKIGEGF